jgi:hypothetical protein
MRIGEHERRRTASRVIASSTVLGLAVLLTGCGSNAPSNEAAPGAAAPGAAPTAQHEEGHRGGRVFFVEPKNGATVKSPVKFVFGADDFTIAPVPEGTVESVRAATGHYHLGVEADCLPVGQEIPRGTPGWVHFGKGDNTIEMQLTPGTHKFSVQAGDDKHVTVAGLCETITVKVE